VQGETSGLGTSLLKCQIIRISEISDIGLKAFLLSLVIRQRQKQNSAPHGNKPVCLAANQY
jgi:hypothetical protein